ncbi:YebC/PmpR family DNA-binding transcriptional regulator [Candidatus Uhrbacteria bacterium]|nr:YebC/PmpR family DNA-binding transcriptional regulator [Candidatus Uhrbacteria bacterium]
MSRHSHWAKIKRGKGSADAARANLFTKLSRLVTVAAREGGGDPAFNFKLRLVLDRAKGEGMSKDAIDRAIARGSGVGGGEVIETVLYEGFAPGGAAVLVECLTDNRNRALGEVKSVFTKQGGNLGGEGSVRWQFERRGVLRVVVNSQRSTVDREEMELALIEAGAEDIREEDGGLVVLTNVEDLQRVREAAERAGLTIADAGLEWIPRQLVDVSEAERGAFEAFLAALDDLDDVQDVYTNARGYA